MVLVGDPPIVRCEARVGKVDEVGERNPGFGVEAPLFANALAPARGSQGIHSPAEFQHFVRFASAMRQILGQRGRLLSQRNLEGLSFEDPLGNLDESLPHQGELIPDSPRTIQQVEPRRPRLLDRAIQAPHREEFAQQNDGIVFGFPLAYGHEGGSRVRSSAQASSPNCVRNSAT